MLRVDNPGHSKTCNFCHQCGIEKDVPSREVTVYNRWHMAVKIEEAPGNIFEDGELDG